MRPESRVRSRPIGARHVQQGQTRHGHVPQWSGCGNGGADVGAATGAAVVTAGLLVLRTFQRGRVAETQDQGFTLLAATVLIAIAAAAGTGGTLAVEKTFATPGFQQPLALGAHIVVHSTTKYLNGHSDMVGGAVVTNDDGVAERLGFLQNAAGAVPGPLDCWLALRGTKTLTLRMRQHDSNGRCLAEWLAGHPAVRTVYYPGLPDHPQHELASRQMRGFGGMISLELGSAARAPRRTRRRGCRSSRRLRGSRRCR